MPSKAINSESSPSFVPSSKTKPSVDFSLIVPLFKARQFAAIESTSSAFVAAFAAPISSSNVSLFVPEPLAYNKLCGPRPEPVPWLPFVTARCGVPPSVATSTSSLNVTVTLKVPPSDLSNSSMFQEEKE